MTDGGRPARTLLVVALVGAAFVAYVIDDSRARRREANEEVERFGRLVATPCWNVDEEAARDCLVVLLASGRYEALSIELADGGRLTGVEGEPPDGPTAAAGLVTTRPIEQPIAYEGRRIGTLHALWIDRRRSHQAVVLALTIAATFLVHRYRRIRGSLAAGQEERRDALEALHRLGEQLRTVIARAPILLFSIDGSGRFTLLQGEGLAALGLTPDEVVGRAAIELADRLPLRAEDVERALAGETLTRIRPCAGRVFETWCSPLEGGRGVIGVSNDVTEVERARRQAAAANRTKSRFLASMSHELRTPLNAIIGYSQLLTEIVEEERLDGRLGDDLGKIDAAGRHLLALIDNILDLSKVEAGRMELSIETFDCPGLVEGVRSIVAPLAESNGCRLEVRIADGVGSMTADATKTRQCLFNLLSNACKFTRDGTVVLEVARRSTGAGDEIVFTVSDTGIGMTPGEMERIFAPFAQADASTARRFGGTGLGLTITREFATLMRGRVDVESQVGVGTTFVLRLPAVVGA